MVGSQVSLYADDLVLFVLPSERDLHTVKAVLAIFSALPLAYLPNWTRASPRRYTVTSKTWRESRRS